MGDHLKEPHATPIERWILHPAIAADHIAEEPVGQHRSESNEGVAREDEAFVGTGDAERLERGVDVSEARRCAIAGEEKRERELSSAAIETPFSQAPTGVAGVIGASDVESNRHAISLLLSAERQRSTAGVRRRRRRVLAVARSATAVKGDGYLNHRARQVQQLPASPDSTSSILPVDT